MIVLPGVGAFLFLLVLFTFTRKPETPLESGQLVETERTIEAVAALGQLTPAGEKRILAAPLSSFGGTPRISELLVDEGDQVEVGQVLAIFDNRPRLMADLAMSKARLKTLKNNIEFQEREVSRYTKTSKEGASPVSLLEAKVDSLRILEGKEKEIVAEINGIKVELDYTYLKSPIDGIVLKINSRVGERPGPGGVLQVGSNQSMEALIEVYESDVSRVNVGQEVSLISENGGFEGTLLGRVSQISPQVRQREVLSTDPTGDADARVVEVRVSLKPGSSSKVSRFTGMKVIARFIP